MSSEAYQIELNKGDRVTFSRVALDPAVAVLAMT